MSYKLIGWNPDRMDMLYAERLKVKFPVVVEPFDGTDCVKVPTRMGIMYLTLESFVYEKL